MTWIPVSERLPKVGKVVLCNHRILGTTIGRLLNNMWVRWQYFDEIQCLSGLTQEGTGKSSITHWMELPKGPEGKRE